MTVTESSGANARDKTEAATGDGAEPWRGSVGTFAAWFVTAAIVTGAANIALREFPSLPVAVRGVLAVVSIPPLIGVIVSGLRVLRRMDELERRIQLETLGCAFGVLGLLLVVYGQAQTAFKLTPEPWTMVWPMMYCIYAGCLIVIRRRYQ
ncbi:MAG: hypothetical protein ACKVU4_08370 [Phycisphaerales bacterium]